jgi:hypothetical protein
MRIKALAPILLSAFVLMAVFGLYMPTLDHMGHETGCPFAPGSTGQCVALLEHAEHWQSSFVAVFAQLLIVLSVGFAFVVFWFLPNIRDPEYERYRLRVRIPIRPPLMQELFSQGILHRKEPQI